MKEPAQQASNKSLPVHLLRHYAPKGEYELLGHVRPRKEVKGASGGIVVVDEGGWTPGEMHPAPLPGTGFPNKIWAGTHLMLPADEAKAIVANRIAEISVDHLGA